MIRAHANRKPVRAAWTAHVPPPANAALRREPSKNIH
jgi:hypothetical protein